jgi:hypothetical protein
MLIGPKMHFLIAYDTHRISTAGCRHLWLRSAYFGCIFSKSSVVGIPIRDILLDGGNIHCITQQFIRLIVIDIKGPVTWFLYVGYYPPCFLWFFVIAKINKVFCYK